MMMMMMKILRMIHELYNNYYKSNIHIDKDVVIDKDAKCMLTS